MGTLFTSDDIGKAVETTDGTEIGVIGEVEDGTAYLEPDSMLADTIKATLGWESETDDGVPIPDDAVRNLTTETVRIEIAHGTAEGNELARREREETAAGHEEQETAGKNAGLEVDPTELADDDPEAELGPEADVDQRTDARVELAENTSEETGSETRTDTEVGDGDANP